MHRQVASLLSTKSPGRLAKLGSALGARKIDIATTGGAEWKHTGPVTLMIKNDWGIGPDDQLHAFAEVMADGQFPWLVFRTIEVELTDEPGSLGGAATALGDVNVYAVTILETSGDKTLVGLGVRPSQVGDAVARLTAANYEARRRRHPSEPDDDTWWDAWDDRTERLIPDFDNPKVAANDRRFYQLIRPTDREVVRRR
jgi:hypothetical protein